MEEEKRGERGGGVWIEASVGDEEGEGERGEKEGQERKL